MSDDQIRSFIRWTNGLLIPGGGELLNYEDGTWTEFTWRISIAYNEAKKLNDEGNHYPIWAVCMGF